MIPLRIPARRALAAAVLVAAMLAGCAKTAPDPLASAKVIQPAELAAWLADSTSEAPVLLHVGFEPLFRAGAIPGSRYVGPGNRPDGIAALEQAVSGLGRDRALVPYCGCCPWVDCPNMRPAFAALSRLGFTNVRPLYVVKNLETNWTMQGYPIEKPAE